MASIRYYKLFDLLARKGLTKTDLKSEVGLSSTTVTKLFRCRSGVSAWTRSTAAFTVGHHLAHLRAVRRAAGGHHGVRAG